MSEHLPSHERQPGRDRTTGKRAADDAELRAVGGPGAGRRDGAGRRRLAEQLQRRVGNHQTGSVLGLGKGEALAPNVRPEAERAYGTSFEDVRIHTDDRAARLAGSQDARAVSYGRHIAFASGAYQPGQLDADAVLAHELAHVAQQSPGRTGEAGAEAETEAETEAEALEADADRSALVGVGALRGGVEEAGTAAPALGSALRIRRCGAASRFPTADGAALAVTGAAPFAPGAYVTTTGAVVTVAITGVPGAPGALPANAVTWKGGTPGVDQFHRIAQTAGPGAVTISASGGGKQGTVTIHVVQATAPPETNPPATLRHLLSPTPAAVPANGHGITVTTIGQQGVKGPKFDVTAHLEGSHWRFRVTEIRHEYKVGVDAHGKPNIKGPGDPAITPDTIGQIIADLTPPGPGAGHAPPREHYVALHITRAHEEAHVTRFYERSWPPKMRELEKEIEEARVPFDPVKAGNAAAAVEGQLINWTVRANLLHHAADDEDFNTVEVATHDVSNPMYAELVNAIRHTVAPPAPSRFSASAGTHNTFLTWRPANLVNTTGFVIQRQAGSGEFVDIANVGPEAREFHDRHVPAGQLTYRVLAVGAAGRSAPSIAQTVTIAP